MTRPLKRNAAAWLAAAGMLLAGCTTDPYTGERQASKTTVGAGVGAAVGAIGGAIVGGKSKRKEMLIGAGIGAIAGGAVGAYMDSQEAKLRRQLQGTGVSVTRVGDNIVLNMPSNITFDVDRADVKPQFYDVLNSVALVLKEFEKTYIDVVGHTDSTGSDAYNQDLSMHRAAAVANYLIAQNVQGERFLIRGMGESAPIAANDTAEGRALNRRVEITLAPVT
ncbi:MAG: cell envelope biogenesis protein OmpA [Alphaproteobacteria bacterium]|nr:MAG: cell envelope biogenesis protein OmpA [Alphaproteobacteria bacterium]